MLKQSFLLISILILSSSNYFSQDEVVMELNDTKVTKSEFLQIYLKNNDNPKFDKASIDEYMELFKKFKLKVAEAEALGYDTVPKLKRELEGYRKQLALPYLIDSTENRAMVTQSYERLKTEVRASHILLRLKPTASVKDTLKAYTRLIELRKRIINGEDFELVAQSKNSSEDPSVATNGGDLGFFTAFQMLYPFEERAYTTAVGKTSMPFRTKYGYHILKVTDKRQARGTTKCAHLMVSSPLESSVEETASAEKKIAEIYALLQDSLTDEKWKNYVAKYSDDPSSNRKGGELPVFGSGTSQRMVPVFEDAAFSIKEDGAISKPVKTDYGYHIIRRIEWNDLKPFEKMEKELQKRVNKDERSKKTQDVFVSKLKTKYGFVQGELQYKDWFVENLDSSFFIGNWTADSLKVDQVMFSIGTKSYRQMEFSKFLRKSFRNGRGKDFKTIVDTQYKEWVKQGVLAYEESMLDSKYPEYKALVQEYHDGIILYEIMSDKVWNKAVKDTTGLKSYYDIQKTKYMWPDRIDATVYICASSDVSDKVFKMLKKKKNNSRVILEEVNEDSELNLDVKMNKYIQSSTGFLKGKSFVKGRNEGYEFENKFYVIFVNEMLSEMPKELSEIKGAVISDYQNHLESYWMKELVEKYPITIYDEVLYNLGPNE
jgi:peptidyl-prolyl cis-trans isomerase SurA